MRKLTANITLLLGLLLTCLAVQATSLVATDYPTMVDRKGDVSRYEALVQEAFKRMGQPLSIDVTRQAFVGSALMGKRVDGELMFLSMNEKDDGMLYSAPYVPVNLYLASRRADVVDVREFYHIEGARVATENRFANTQELRVEKNVKWSRNPAAFDVFRQIGDERAEYILADKLLLKEFNRVLDQANRDALFLSTRPLVQAFMHISIRDDVANASALIERFNTTIENMMQDGSYNTLLDVAWLSKDLDGDGTAELITSSTLFHDDLTKDAISSALPLDNSVITDNSVFYVDGQAYDSFESAISQLKQNPGSPRESFLDEARYKRMMQDW